MRFLESDEVFKCPCHVCRKSKSPHSISPILVEKLNNMVSLSGNIFNVTSGYRCEAHNRDVGGSPKSQHLLGNAVDVTTLGDSHLAYQIVDAAMVHNITFIELAPRHVHLDIREGETKLVFGSRG